LQELARLAIRLEIDQAQMEAQIGKTLNTLTRPEAKDWIKKLRAIADEIAPTQKSRFGSWPGGEEDREAAYLREQRDAHATFAFKLFNGEQISGTITDFTPYTITVSTGDGEETVLRKLAIAYYRRTGQSQDGASPSTATEQSGEASPALQASEPTSQDPATDDHHQPLDTGTDSDRAGEPDVPERDNMDEDRGV
jgi:sRNA-binding regulator protein Hfq